jgi:multidrug efflux system membrane fusion protein
VVEAKRRILTIIVLCGLVAGAWHVVEDADQFDNARGNADAPVQVRAAAVHTANAPVYLTGVGTTKALNTVTVRPEVDGRLIRIAFREGQDVRRGDVLAQIDPTTYQAQLAEAIAKKAQSEAQLANARLDLDRSTRLTAATSVSLQQLDTQRALVAQLEAQVRLDQAAIDIPQAHLHHTTITSPVDGRTGIRLVDEGNIVQAEDSAGIVVITQIRPISVLLGVPQQRLRQVNRALARGAVAAEIIDTDGATIIDRGALRVVDNQIDPTTGTVQVKAEFPNGTLKLWPGQFVNVRLLVDMLNDVVVVPVAAIRQGPDGIFVYVIQADETVLARPIVISQQDERQAVIASGLGPSDRVVTSGFAQLTDGRRVSIAHAEDAETPAPVKSLNAPLTRNNIGPDHREGRQGNATVR